MEIQIRGKECMGKGPGGLARAVKFYGCPQDLGKSANKIYISGLTEGVCCAEVMAEKRRTARTRRWESYAISQHSSVTLTVWLEGKSGISWKVLTQIRSRYKRVTGELRIPVF